MARPINQARKPTTSLPSAAQRSVVDRCRVPPDGLRAICNPDRFPFETTDEVPPLTGPIGQERAMDALRFGLNATTPGFNIFVAGAPGVGRTTTARTFVDEAAGKRPAARDWCYVHNFDDPYQPIAISLAPGQGRQFVKRVEDLVESAHVAVNRSLESDEFRRQRDAMERSHREAHEKIMERVTKTAKEMGFQIVVSPTGIMTIPVRDGQPISDEAYEALPDDEKQQLRKSGAELTAKISAALAETRAIDQQVAVEVEALTKQVVTEAIEPAFSALFVEYSNEPKVVTHLKRMQADMIEHVDDIRRDESKSQKASAESVLDRLQEASREDTLTKYGVNLIVDNHEAAHAPVVLETNPTFYNLIGRIEYRARFGAMTTSFQLIKPGALHRANGGYLVLNVLEVLRSPLAWDTLKRTMLARSIQVENIADQFTAIPTSTLRPEPIPLDVKVVLTGTPFLYYLLYFNDEQMRKLFKVKADFDSTAERTPEHVDQFAAFVSRVAREAKLLPFDRTAVARLVEQSTRAAGDQSKLSARLSDTSDLAAEASYWASQSGSPVCRDVDVRRAVEQKIYRSNLTEEKLRRLMADGTIYIDTSGERKFQVNGLAVLSLGDYEFAQPVRVTARTSVGASGIANLEREAHLSGPIHSKGFLILSGFFAGRYGQDKPLALDARITFEQSYDEVEGDSASSTELYALMSALADLPLRQDVAVTGSVDQEGRIQPVGGVTQKVEGFYEACRQCGLTGRQGVLIPATNVRNLVLREEVADVVRAGRFTIWAIDSVDEGIEILTGVPAGARHSDGGWERGSVNDRVNHRLDEFASRLRAFGRGGEAGRETFVMPSPPVTPQTPRVDRPTRKVRRR